MNLQHPPFLKRKKRKEARHKKESQIGVKPSSVAIFIQGVQAAYVWPRFNVGAETAATVKERHEQKHAILE